MSTGTQHCSNAKFPVHCTYCNGSHPCIAQEDTVSLANIQVWSREIDKCTRKDLLWQNSNISKINDVLLQQCKKYVKKIANNTNHRLFHLLPPKQSARGRHSSRLADRNSQTARTAKMCQNVFNLLQIFCFSFLMKTWFFILDCSHIAFSNSSVNSILNDIIVIYWSVNKVYIN